MNNNNNNNINIDSDEGDKNQLLPIDGLCQVNNNIFPDINNTCPAALISIGLIYFNSFNHSIIEILSLPHTIKGYTVLRSDFYMLYIITSGLVQWDLVDIKNKNFISSLIPNIITDSYSRLVNNNNSCEYSEYEKEIIKSIYLYTKCGICFLFGLKYSGTFNKTVRDYLYNELTWIYTQLCNDFHHSDLHILYQCLSIISSALSIVMAGSGDLEILKLYRAIVKTANFPFSVLSGINNAIGLLFLSGGGKTLGNSMKDIAFIYISFYPIYSNDIGDNDCYGIVYIIIYYYTYRY